MIERRSHADSKLAGADFRARLVRGTRRELAVLFRTFLGAWLLLSSATLLYGLVTSPERFRGVGDIVFSIAVGFVMFAFYMFWPAVVVALARFAHRLVGVAAFVPLPVVVAGIAGVFWLGEDFLAARTQQLFRELSGSGSCGGHASGPAMVLSLACLAFATLTKPAALWALATLVASVLGLFVLGALPGVALFIVLIARALIRRARGVRQSVA